MMLPGELMTEAESIRLEIAELRQDVVDLTSSVQGLVDAWGTANNLVRFIKWLSAFVAAVGVIIGAVKFILRGHA